MIPEPLQLLQDVRIQIKSGKALSTALRVVEEMNTSLFHKSVKIWRVRVESGQKSADILKTLQEVNKTSARKALISIFEKGLTGIPIDSLLADLENDMFVLIEQSYERHLQVLPLKLLIPLLLFILPGVMLLLMGPLLYLMGHSV